MARVMLPSGSNVVADMPLNRPCFRAKSMPACAQFPAAGISVKRLPGQFAPPSQGVSPVFGMTSVRSAPQRVQVKVRSPSVSSVAGIVTRPASQL